MTASEVDHEIVLNQGAWPKPTAKAHHGTHHRKNTLGPRHSRSRSESPELDISLLVRWLMCKTLLTPPKKRKANNNESNHAWNTSNSDEAGETVNHSVQ